MESVAFISPFVLIPSPLRGLTMTRSPRYRVKECGRLGNRRSTCMRFRRGAEPVVSIPERVDLAEGMLDAEWKPFDCSRLKGKVVLAVNVASLDDDADYHYKLLVDLYDKYRDRGLEILAFPNNWYFEQKEPWPSEEVRKHVMEKYGATFPIMGKSDIDINPIFRLGQTRFDGDILWNFEGRFLFGRNGLPAERFGLQDTPEHVETRILEELMCGEEQESDDP